MRLKQTTLALLCTIVTQLLAPSGPLLSAEPEEGPWPTVEGPAELVTAVADWGRDPAEGEFAAARLVLWADSLTDSHGAEKVLSCPSCGEYVLQYASPMEAETACAAFRESLGEAYCWPDGLIHADTASYGWGAASMGMEGVMRGAYSLPGSAMVAVIDSGCSLSHPLLKDRVSPDSYDFVSGTARMSDWSEDGAPGHGTAVAGIIADSTPSNVEILMLRVFSERGYASSLGFANAMLYALECGADVINMSIGVEDPYDTEWDVPLARVYAAGVPFDCAAGNEGGNVSEIYPANSPYTLAVSSVDEALRISDYSNTGAGIDFCAPGDNLVTADSTTGGFAVATGTSFSAPYIAAATAYVKLLHPGYDVEQVVGVLRDCCMYLGAPGKDNTYGWGVPLIRAYLASEQPYAADMLLFGSAVDTGAELRLTDSVTDQRGMASWLRPLSTAEGFSISLEYRAEPASSLSSGGIGIMFSSSPGTPPGDSFTGGWLNLRPDPDMVAVALDSFQLVNQFQYTEYIEIVAGSAEGIVAQSEPCDIVCDSLWHVMEIRGTASGLTVIVDGVPYVSASLPLPETAYVSVTASTGDNVSRQMVRKLSFSGVFQQTAPEPSNPAGPAASAFYDVADTDYFSAAVAWALNAGVTGGLGEGRFGPAELCTRAQAVTFLWRAAGSPVPVSDWIPFSDVPPDAWYADAVRWAYAGAVTGGVNQTEFGPDQSCTRAQIVTFLYRAFGEKLSANLPYDDVNEWDYYFDAVRWAYAAGVTAGSGATTFSPDKICTRAQIVTFLYRALEVA